MLEDENDDEAEVVVNPDGTKRRKSRTEVELEVARVMEDHAESRHLDMAKFAARPRGTRRAFFARLLNRSRRKFWRISGKSRTDEGTAQVAKLVKHMPDIKSPAAVGSINLGESKFDALLAQGWPVGPRGTICTSFRVVVARGRPSRRVVVERGRRPFRRVVGRGTAPIPTRWRKRDGVRPDASSRERGRRPSRRVVERGTASVPTRREKDGVARRVERMAPPQTRGRRPRPSPKDASDPPDRAGPRISWWTRATRARRSATMTR